MSLHEIASRVVALHDQNGRIDVNKAIKDGVPLVKNDAEALDEAVHEALGRKIARLTTRSA